MLHEVVAQHGRMVDPGIPRRVEEREAIVIASQGLEIVDGGILVELLLVAVRELVEPCRVVAPPGPQLRARRDVAAPLVEPGAVAT